MRGDAHAHSLASKGPNSWPKANVPHRSACRRGETGPANPLPDWGQLGPEKSRALGFSVQRVVLETWQPPTRYNTSRSGRRHAQHDQRHPGLGMQWPNASCRG